MKKQKQKQKNKKTFKYHLFKKNIILKRQKKPFKDIIYLNYK